MSVTDLLCMIVTIQVGKLGVISACVFPKINYPPYRTDNKLELLQTSEEGVLKATYNLPSDCSTTWVLAFYLLSGQNESWEAGVVMNHFSAVDKLGHEKDSGKERDEDDHDTSVTCGEISKRYNDYEELEDVMVILGKDWSKRVANKTWPRRMSWQTSSHLPLRLIVTSNWLEVNVNVGSQTLLQERYCFPQNLPHFPDLRLAVSCHGFDCGLQRGCTKIKLPGHLPHRLLTSTRSENEEEVLEAEFEIYPQPDRESWYIFFYAYTMHKTKAMTGINMIRHKDGNGTKDTLYVWDESIRAPPKEDPSPMRTSGVTTLRTLKFEMRASGIRVYETTAGRRLMRAESNVSLSPAFPEVWLGVWGHHYLHKGNIYLFSGCRKKVPIIAVDRAFEGPYELTKLWDKFMLLVILTLLGVGVAMLCFCHQLLDTILHYLLPSTP